MNRTDGLVRRNKNRGDNGSSEPNSSTANSVDDNDVIINERDDEIDDNDSKETRLTLMEEVLLLGLKDKEVMNRIRNGMSNLHWSPATLFFFCFLFVWSGVLQNLSMHTAP